MTNKILITGGAGFIGSFLADELIKKGNEVRILDSLEKQVHPDGKPNYLNSRAEFIQGDVTNSSTVKKAIENIDIVFHYAAAVGISQSNYQMEKFSYVNSVGTANVLQSCVDSNVKKIIIPGSNTSYGEGLYYCEECSLKFHPDIRNGEQLKKKIWQPMCPNCSKEGKAIPTPEETEQKCNSVYAVTKKNQEEVSRVVSKLYGIPITIFRFFNVFGPRQSLRNPYTGVSAIFTSRIKNNGIPLIYEDGKQTRDFVSVHDIARANILAMNNKAADNKTFNVGSSIPTSIEELAITISRIMNKDIKPEITGDYRKGDIRHCIADTKKIKDVLDFKTKISFEQGMKELIKWSENEEADDKLETARRELEERGLS